MIQEQVLSESLCANNRNVDIISESLAFQDCVVGVFGNFALPPCDQRYFSKPPVAIVLFFFFLFLVLFVGLFVCLFAFCLSIVVVVVFLLFFSHQSIRTARLTLKYIISTSVLDNRVWPLFVTDIVMEQDNHY